MRFLRALGYAIEEAFIELWRNRLVNLVSIGTIAVSLFILGIFLSVSAGLRDLAAGWASRVQLTVYLSETASSSVRAHLDEALSQSGEVDSFTFVSKEDAVVRFQSYFPELRSLPALLDANPLPASYEVQIAADYRQPEQVHAFASKLAIWDGVADVDYDLLWIERLTAVLELLRAIGVFVGAALVVASVFTIFNVIKLTVYGRQDEIGIMRLVGATHAYIRGPFLVEGVLQGGFGGLLALALLFACHEFLVREALDSFQLLPSSGALSFVPPAAWVVIVAGGMLVGLIGSTLSVRKFLSRAA